MPQFYDICNDIAFKKVFNQHENLTIKFLNSTLRLEEDRAIQSIQFLPQELLPNLSESKKSILDVKCTDQRGFQYIVEVQNKSLQPYLQRIQYYVSHTYSSQLKVAQSYLELKPVTMLSILNHKLFPDDIPSLSFHANVELETQSSYLKDMSYAFIELPKFNKRWENLKTPEDYWIYILKESHQMQDIPAGAPEEIQEVLTLLEEHTWSEGEREAYIKAKMTIFDDEAFISTARSEGKAEGVAEGAKIKQIEIALNLLHSNVDLSIISQSTGLSVDEIKTLKL